jgi:hypothetical protein
MWNLPRPFNGHVIQLRGDATARVFAGFLTDGFLHLPASFFVMMVRQNRE